MTLTVSAGRSEIFYPTPVKELTEHRRLTSLTPTITMAGNQGNYTVDLSGKRARRRYPSRELPTIVSGEASSLHSSEYGIFFGASSLGDDESDEGSTSSQDYSTRSDSRSGSYSSVEESSRDTTPSRMRLGTDPSVSSEYSSGSPWESGTDSSMQSHESDDDDSISKSYERSHYASASGSTNSNEDVDINEDDELESVLDSILSEVTPPRLSRNETGSLKENPIVIDSEDHNSMLPSSIEEATSLSLEDNIDTYAEMKHVKRTDRKDCKEPSNSLLLKHVRYGHGIEIASTSRDISTVNFLTRNDTLEAFHQKVPKVLACVHDSIRDDISSIDNRSLKERMKDKYRKSKKARNMPTTIDEEHGLGHSVAHSTNAPPTGKLMELSARYLICGGRSEMELCFFILITISLFTLIILIAILLAQN